MNAEFVSFDTVKKIAFLEKEKKKQSEIISKFDEKINEQYKIIKEVFNLLKTNQSNIELALQILKRGLSDD